MLTFLQLVYMELISLLASDLRGNCATSIIIVPLLCSYATVPVFGLINYIFPSS